MKMKPIIPADKSHVVTAGEDCTIWDWESDDCCQIVYGTENRTAGTEIKHPEDKKWVSVSVGEHHIVAIDENGSLWICGRNEFHQSNYDMVNERNKPVKIDFPRNHKWEFVSAGGGHTVALDEDGQLWAWGRNNYGQIGYGTTTNSNIPVLVEVEGVGKWKHASAGWNCTLAIDENGSLWTWGGNDTDQRKPTRIGADTDWALVYAGRSKILAEKMDGAVWDF